MACGGRTSFDLRARVTKRRLGAEVGRTTEGDRTLIIGPPGGPVSGSQANRGQGRTTTFPCVTSVGAAPFRVAHFRAGNRHPDHDASKRTYSETSLDRLGGANRP
jgi:hypothetical protein